MFNVASLSAVEPAEPWSVISHGDFHMWNMAFAGVAAPIKVNLLMSQALVPMSNSSTCS
jgi:hypothetical protein